MKKLLMVGIFIFVFDIVGGTTISKLGHHNSINFLKSDGNYLLSMDELEYWVLWDTNTKSQVLSGNLSVDIGKNLDLQNGIFVVSAQNGFDLYSLPSITPKRVNSDSIRDVHVSGEFVWAGNSTSLKVWNKNGLKVLNLSGDFSRSRVSTDSLQLFVATPGVDSLLSYSLSNFSALPSIHFDGNFNCWTIPGQRFLTTQGSIVRTYTTQGIREGLQDIGKIENLSGYGDFFWTHANTAYPEYPLRIYKSGSSDVPDTLINTGGGSIIVGARGFIGIVEPGPDSVTVCQLKNDGIVVYKVEGAGAYLTAFESNISGTHFTGNKSGVVGYSKKSGPISKLNYGIVRWLSGSSNGFLAAATSSGQVLIFQNKNGSAVLVDSIQNNAGRIKLSTDARYLATQGNASDNQYSQDRSIYLFDLKTQTLVKKWDFKLEYPTIAQSLPVDFDISDDGRLLSLRLEPTIVVQTTPSTLKVFEVASDSAIFSLEGVYKIAPQISPNGKYFAVGGDSIVKLYSGNQLINAFSGNFGGWYPENKLILNSYKIQCGNFGCGSVWSRSYLIDSSGKVDSSLHFSNAPYNSIMISDSEMVSSEYAAGIYPPESWSVSNLSSGKVAFSTNSLRNQLNTGTFKAALLGSDFAAYQNTNTLDIVNWRQYIASILPKKFETASENIHFEKGRIVIRIFLKQRKPVQAIFLSLNGTVVSSISMGVLNRGDQTISIPIDGLFQVNRSNRTPIVLVIRAGLDFLDAKKIMF